MMQTAAGSSSLDGLLSLIEYVKDAKRREKELRALVVARDENIAARKALERAHGGVAKLAEAEQTLSQAQTTASNILADANAEAKELVEAAQRKAGDIATDRENITRDAAILANKQVSFDKTSAAQIKEFERREGRVTKRENDIARARTDLGQDQDNLRKKAQGVADAMRG